MDGALVVVLVLAWALLLLPSALRSRRSSPHATVGGFEEAMAVLRNRPQGREVMVPGDAARIVGYEDDEGLPADAPVVVRYEQPPARIDAVLARRRRTLARLGAGTAVAVLLALIGGGLLWTVAVVSLGALGGYVALLRRWKLQREQAREVVRMLRTSQRRHEAETVKPVAHAVGEVPHIGGWDDLQVATAPDEPWRQGAGVRIRRWEG